MVDFKTEIWDLLRSIAESIETVLHPVTGKYDLTISQLHVLLEMKPECEHTVGNLAKSAGIAGANTSAICKKLQKQGFVIKRRDAFDARVVKIILTAKGREAVDFIEQFLQKQYTVVLDKEKNRAALQGVVGAVYTNWIKC